MLRIPSRITSRVAAASVAAGLVVLLAACATAPQGAPASAAPANSASPAAVPPEKLGLVDLLLGSDWVVQRIEGIGALGTPLPWLRWTSATQVVGNGGCNQFAGKAMLSETEARLGPLASTRMACMPTPSGQEDKFFKALESTAQARLERGVLVLLNAQGTEVMRLNRQVR